MTAEEYILNVKKARQDAILKLEKTTNEEHRTFLQQIIELYDNIIQLGEGVEKAELPH